MSWSRAAFLAALLVPAAFVAPLSAQEGDDEPKGLKPLKPGEGPPIEDLEGWLDGPDAKKPAKPPARARVAPKAEARRPAPRAEDAPPAADPLAGEGKADEPDPLAPAPAAPSKAEERNRARAIDRNFREAEGIYREVLEADPLKPLDRRIANNERIVREHRARIAAATRERREMQVVLYNQTFRLKQQVDQGKLTRDAYQKMLAQEELKFGEKSKTLKTSVASWAEEIKLAEARLAELRAQRQLIESQRPRRPKVAAGKKGGPAAPPGSALLGTLQERLRRLGKFDTRHTLAGVHPRSLEGAAAAPSEKAEQGAEEKKEAEEQ